MRSGFITTISILMFIFISSCEEFSGRPYIVSQGKDTVAPLLRLLGKEIDTTYVQTSLSSLLIDEVSGYTWHPGYSTVNYRDPGVAVLDEINGETRCADLSLEISGTVNNKTPGVYVLSYNTEDYAGNRASTISRTVYVVENDAAFLNGDYSVACNSTITAKNANTPTITTTNYTAYVVASANSNNHLTLSALKTGCDYSMPYMYLNGNTFNLSSYCSNYNSTVTTAALSPGKNTFTIEVCDYFPDGKFTYTCNSIYSKIKNEKFINLKNN